MARQHRERAEEGDGKNREREDEETDGMTHCFQHHILYNVFFLIVLQTSFQNEHTAHRTV